MAQLKMKIIEFPWCLGTLESHQVHHTNQKRSWTCLCNTRELLAVQ